MGYPSIQRPIKVRNQPALIHIKNRMVASGDHGAIQYHLRQEAFRERNVARNVRTGDPMTYRSLLSVLTDIELANASLRHLAAQARIWNAHAGVQCIGVDRNQVGPGVPLANAAIPENPLARAQVEAEEIRSRAEAKLEKTEIRYSLNAEVALLANLGQAVAANARFADLVVLPGPYGKGRSVTSEVVTEAALFGGHAPVLIVPDPARSPATGGTVLVAWNESDEALAAVRRALPFLTAAELVRIAVVAPHPHSPERSDPGGNLAQLLARHGAHCEIDVLNRSLPRVSDVLLRHAGDTDAGLLVMGAYGHRRLRESLFGGSTRDMLRECPIPLLMAH